ncbi:MAG TPA: hypothetical protein PKO18_00195 [Chitinophagales bacterium]|nr:hypothetical protein [Chitinophagales bacterium]
MKTAISKIAICIFAVTATIACKKEKTNNDYIATLSMSVNGTPYTSNNAFAFINNNSLLFGVQQQNDLDIFSGSSYIGNAINTDYTIDVNTVTSGGGLSQILYQRRSSITDVYNFPLGDERGRFSYRIIKKQTIGSGPNSTKCDINFSGVLYKINDGLDSIVITNGTIRH